jgi:SAM-dependent methyltransferase
LPKTLRGDRNLEYGWAQTQLDNIGVNGRRLLDVGCGGGFVALEAHRAGALVTACDLEPAQFPVPAGMTFIQGDLLTTAPAGQFDIITCISTVEHAGLAGRYGVTEPFADGDLAMMRTMRAALSYGGRLLLTVPVGVDKVCGSLHRIYGRNRLPLLLDGWKIEESQFFRKSRLDKWQACTQRQAMNEEGGDGYYAIGTFVLR